MTARDAQPFAIIEAGNLLGECALWDCAAQALWWTDIEASRLHRYDWATRACEVFDTPERLGSFALTTQPGVLIAAFETGVAAYVPHTQSIRWLARPLQRGSGIRFNDGRTDRSGRFWVGTMGERSLTGAAGTLYSFDVKQGFRSHVHDIGIVNGICFSADAQRCYWADSACATIYCCNFDFVSGTMAPSRVFATVAGGAAPDGANVDSSSRVWSAEWGGSRVVCYSQEGLIVRQISLPVSQPTCIAFGGPDMNLLFVTSARAELSPAELERQPLAGNVLVYEVGTTGMADARFELPG